MSTNMKISLAPRIAGVRDLGTQTAMTSTRMEHVAAQALLLWPELAVDGAKAKSETNVTNWADFDAGVRSYFDQSHAKLYAVRDERGEYTTATIGTSDELVDADRARLGVKKTDSPTLHAILAARKNEIDRFTADKRRDLRDWVKRIANGTKVRGGSKDFAEWFAKHLDTATTKVKTVRGKGGYDVSKLDAVTAWIEEGRKLGII